MSVHSSYVMVLLLSWSTSYLNGNKHLHPSSVITGGQGNFSARRAVFLPQSV